MDGAQERSLVRTVKDNGRWIRDDLFPGECRVPLPKNCAGSFFPLSFSALPDLMINRGYLREKINVLLQIRFTRSSLCFCQNYLNRGLCLRSAIFNEVKQTLQVKLRGKNCSPGSHFPKYFRLQSRNRKRRGAFAREGTVVSPTRKHRWLAGVCFYQRYEHLRLRYYPFVISWMIVVILFIVDLSLPSRNEAT